MLICSNDIYKSIRVACVFEMKAFLVLNNPPFL